MELQQEFHKIQMSLIRIFDNLKSLAKIHLEEDQLLFEIEEGVLDSQVQGHDHRVG